MAVISFSYALLGFPTFSVADAMHCHLLASNLSDS
jgi:hypothetical protein